MDRVKKSPKYSVVYTEPLYGGIHIPYSRSVYYDAECMEWPDDLFVYFINFHLCNRMASVL